MLAQRDDENRLRLANLLAALSLETDLAMGHPAEEAMRTCLVATWLARHLGLPNAQMSAVYWTSLLMHVGCTAYAHEQAAFFGGDEIAVNALGSQTDDASPREMIGFLRELSKGMGAAEQVRMYVLAITRGTQFGHDVSAATCEVASAMAARLDLPEAIEEGFHQLFERWDGKGDPQGISGDEILLQVRIAQIASQAIVFDRLTGIDGAIGVVRRRAGSALDPNLADAFIRDARELLAESRSGDPFQKVLAAEPHPHRWADEAQIDRIARAFADVVDVKSPFTLGHSSGVASLAERTGRELGLSSEDRVLLRRAGYLHDLGRVGIPNGIWEKNGALTSAEWEQVRLHPYHSERILRRSPALAPLADIVGMHHERLDGSGYYRQATAGSIPMTARILAAADVYHGLTQDRAHRPALTPSDAADRLASQARDGRLDVQAVEAVLAAAGQASGRSIRHQWPAGLTDREVEVLIHIAHGLSNRDVARKLFISRKTVGRHVEHIYEKLGISSRAAAALFALQHDLLPTDVATHA